MKVYTIEELHNLIVNQEIDLNKYYEELFDEEELDIEEDELEEELPMDLFFDRYQETNPMSETTEGEEA